jgi:peptide/nickel transport system permease protein
VTAPARILELAGGLRGTDRHPAGVRIALAILAILAVSAFLAPLVAPYAPDALDLASRRAPPSLAHWMGTDELGRDLFTRVLFGARISLTIGLLSAALSVALGSAVGAIAGFAGGRLDAWLMRVTDAMLAVPRLPLLMIAAAILHPTIPLLIVLVGLAGWMETARVVRSEVISLAERGFVEAALATGATTTQILVRHILPNVYATIAVAATLSVGRGILMESALSFFGVGVQPPAASWGNMLYQAQTAMTSEPWLALFPGLAIFVTVICVNVVGEHLSARRSSGLG